MSAVVYLATCAALPAGEPGGELLLDAFAGRGWQARWKRWDDPGVDWAAPDVVAVRSTWDYETRPAEFLAWSGRVGGHLLHGPEVFAWNTAKTYLLALAEAGVPVVPTVVAEEEGDLPRAIAGVERAVVKPVTGAGGRGVVLFDGAGAIGLDEGRLGTGPWVVQPLIDSVRTEGEHSVFVLGGEPVSQVRKVPGEGEIRVQEEYGGSTVPVTLDHDAAALARRTVRAAERLLGQALCYARVDLLRMPEGDWAVGELEVTEPGLYLDVVPGNAAAFAAMVVALVADSDRAARS